jgi:mono/diheme cytochrome c family protein
MEKFPQVFHQGNAGAARQNLRFWVGRVGFAARAQNPAGGHNLEIMRYQERESRQQAGGVKRNEGLRAMTVFRRGFGLAIGVLALCSAGAAGAQENLDQGKSPAQLFASDCAICHKSPQGLAKAGGILGLESFLREHYTASRESAAAIASYLKAVGQPPAGPARRATTTKRNAKGDDKAKTGEKKPGTGGKPVTLPGDDKPAQGKSSGSTPAESKPSETKTSEPKASEPKASETKPAETKPAEKPAESKPADPKPADSPKSD